MKHSRGTISGLRFTITTRGQQMRTAITANEATYMLVSGPQVQIGHHGQVLTLAAGEPTTLAIPSPPHVGEVSQPDGRVPLRRAARRS